MAPHDPRDLLVIDHQAVLAAEFSGDPRGAVRIVGVLVSLVYPGRELCAGSMMGRAGHGGAAPVVEARVGEYPAASITA